MATQAPPAQKSFEQVNYEARVYQEQLRMLQKEIDRMSLTNLDLVNAEKTADSLVENESLIPIGGGAFIKATISQTDILVPVGANYLVEMDRKAAKEVLSKRIDATKNAVDKLNAETMKIYDKLREAQMLLSQLQTQRMANKKVNDNIREDYF